MVVDSESDQEGIRVLFEQVNDAGEIRNQYIAARANADIPSIAKEGKQIPKPVIGAKPKKKESDGGDRS